MNCFNKTNMKLVKTDLYLLLIDEEAEIFQMDYYIDDDYNTVFKATLSSDQYKGCKKVVAYYPLTKEAKELDLPLLPNPFKEDTDVERLADEWFLINNYNKEDLIHSHTIPNCITNKNLFIAGYKAAQSKQFSLEDIKKAIEMARMTFPTDKLSCDRHSTEHIIQSLSTQQLPKEFIPEYNLMNKGYDKPEDYPYQECKVLKTIINSEGKKELVGTYKY